MDCFYISFLTSLHENDTNYAWLQGSIHSLEVHYDFRGTLYTQPWWPPFFPLPASFLPPLDGSWGSYCTTNHHRWGSRTIANTIAECHPGRWEVLHILTSAQEDIRISAFVFAPHQWLFEVLSASHCFVAGTGGRWESSDRLLALKDKQNAIERGADTLGWHRDTRHECQGTLILCDAILPSRAKRKSSMRCSCLKEA